MAGRRRPRIGITGPDRGGWPAWLFASWVVRRLGGRPVRLRPGHPRDVCLHGVIVGGGADVSPELYGWQDPSETSGSLEAEYESLEHDLGRVQALLSLVLAPLIWLMRRLFGRKRAYVGLDTARDEFELAIMRRAQDHALPLLGICRGAQLMNVFAGGDLHRDLAEFYVETANPWTILPRKRVQIQNESMLHDVLELQTCRVNSLHRQAVGRLGGGLRISAQDAAAITQAIERTDGLFWVGVQWHPEYLPQRPEQRRLIGEIIERARACEGATIKREELVAMTPRTPEPKPESPQRGAPPDQLDAPSNWRELFPAGHRCSHEGRERRFGFELEFAGVELSRVSERLARRLAGEAHQHNDYRWIIETADGSYSLENDISWLQRIAEERRNGEDLSVGDELADRVVGPVARQVMPLELVAPPLPFDRLGVLDEAVDELRRAGAVGTWDQPVYGFGVHINPEPWAVDAATLTAVIQAYAILQRFLIELLHVDPTRRLLPFVKPYPDRYVERVVAQDYAPDFAGLIDDYLRDNPTRDRSLDMLPLFAFLDHDRVSAAELDQAELIKPRPTFHYRLPNSGLDDPSWKMTGELRSWALVEQLAADADRLADAAADMRRDIERKIIRHPRPDDEAPWLRELLRRVGYER